jgi:hypothetical protein
MDLDLSIIGWLHSLACVVALATSLAIIVRRKGGAAHRAWGQVFTVSYMLVCVTSLGIYALERFWFPHWLAVIGLVVVAIGWGAARFRPPGWRYVHLIAMLLSVLNLFGGAVNEAFLRIESLSAMIGNNFASPIVGMAHSLNMLVFVVLIVVHVVLTWLRHRPRRKRTVATGAAA